MSKKVISMVIILVLLFGLVACSSDNKAESVSVQPTKNEASAEDVCGGNETEATQVSIGAVVIEGNMLENGCFDDDQKNWNVFTYGGGVGSLSVVDGAGFVDVSDTGSENYSVQVFYDGLKLYQGGVYQFSFDIDTTLARNVGARIQLNGGDYFGYTDNYIDIEPGMKHYSFDFQMDKETDKAPRICFNLGTPNGESKLPAHTITIDNVAVVLLDGSKIVESEDGEGKPINLNQIGFLPDARKTVVVRSKDIDSSFEIIDKDDNVYYTGTLSGPVAAEYAGEEVMQGDFSDFTTPGSYYIRVSNGATSYPFVIDETVYNKLLRQTFQFFYKQRCGTKIEATIAREIAHVACHTEPATIYGTNEKKDVSGGWHDAGDYGRYVVAGVSAVAGLFETYEDYPELWNSDDVGIPESGNGIPDMLDEIKYELDWMLKMQDEKSGGVYHKVTCRSFPDFVMPMHETDELVLAPISATATGDFAAIMAQASIVYRDYDPDFAKQCLKQAEFAWNCLESNPDMPGFTNPSDIQTGEYPDQCDKDERYYAATMLYKATGNEEYLKRAEQIESAGVPSGLGWDAMGTYADMAYLSIPSDKQDPDTVQRIMARIAASALEYLNNSNSDGYMVDLGSNYCWGSNLAVCSYAKQMLLAAETSAIPGKEEELKRAAYDQLSYLLGQNSVGYCFVTGFGSVYPANVHHRPSEATHSLVYGMLVGGPDGSLEDPYTQSAMNDLPPAKVYADNTQSYSTNEVTIYWNNLLVYLISYVCSE